MGEFRGRYTDLRTGLMDGALIDSSALVSVETAPQQGGQDREVAGMARMARLVVPHYPYHVTQRAAQTRVLAYCLMPNHVHFLMVPNH